MQKPVVVLTRKLPEEIEARLKKSYQVLENSEDKIYSKEEILNLCKNADALVATISYRFDEDFIQKLSSSVKIISTFSVGYEHIDVKSAKDKGLAVTNTPGALTEATADIAFLLLLGAARNASEGERIVRSGAWNGWGPTQLLGLDLNGKNLGIFGMGRIGKAVAKRALGFGMKIHYNSRTRLPLGEENGMVWHDSFESLLRVSNYLSLHCPLLPETKNILNSEKINLLPDGAVVINTSRGSVVDDNALINALKSGKLFAVGLDVYTDEPAINPEYLKLKNCFLLPHLGSATIETRLRMGNLLVDNLDAFFANKSLISPL